MHENVIMSAIIVILLVLFVVLLERKLLAFSQRRMGPTLMGGNGALQHVLDLFKLLTKEVFLIPKTTTVMAPIFLLTLSDLQKIFPINFPFRCFNLIRNNPSSS